VEAVGEDDRAGDAAGVEQRPARQRSEDDNMWSFWKRKQRERDLDDEIAHDLALNADERAREGAPLEEAVRESRRDFGNVAMIKEETRGAWGWVWLGVFIQDIRYGARTLRKSSGFAATAIVALALGIGVNTASFTISDQIAFRPLPIRQRVPRSNAYREQ
jgi:hypothetical protein